MILDRGDCVRQEVSLDGKMVGHPGCLEGDRIRTAREGQVARHGGT